MPFGEVELSKSIAPESETNQAPNTANAHKMLLIALALDASKARPL
jgi:hypothetical protein